jgi:hypothetical protein
MLEVHDKHDQDVPRDQLDSGRLRIFHLLIWTTVCAVVTGLRLAWIRAYVTPDYITTQFLVAQVIISVIHGAAFSGFLLLVWRWYQGSRTFPTQPGHWLLLLVSEFYPTAVLNPWNTRLFVVSVLGTTTCFLFLAFKPWPRLWQIVVLPPYFTLCVFGAFQLAIVLRKLSYNFQAFLLGAYIPILGCTISFIVLLAVTYIDRRNSTSRDWFHWAGLCTFGAALLACIADQFRFII